MQKWLERLKEVPSTCVADGQNGENAMDTSIKPLKEEDHLCGKAFTVSMPAGDNLAVLQAISEAQPGDILVIDSKGYTSRSVAGDFVIGLAKVLGLGGAVIDGSIRDVKSIKSMDFPIFCKNTTSAASVKTGNGKVGVTISCGGVAVEPGDFIVGDADGVVVIPKNKIQEVCVAAENKLKRDEERAKKALVSTETARAYLREILK